MRFYNETENLLPYVQFRGVEPIQRGVQGNSSSDMGAAAIGATQGLLQGMLLRRKMETNDKMQKLDEQYAKKQAEIQDHKLLSHMLEAMLKEQKLKHQQQINPYQEEKAANEAFAGSPEAAAQMAEGFDTGDMSVIQSPKVLEKGIKAILSKKRIAAQNKASEAAAGASSAAAGASNALTRKRNLEADNFEKPEQKAERKMIHAKTIETLKASLKTAKPGAGKDAVADAIEKKMQSLPPEQKAEELETIMGMEDLASAQKEASPYGYGIAEVPVPETNIFGQPKTDDDGTPVMRKERKLIPKPQGAPRSARLAPDGKWYVKKDGKYYMVTE